MKKSLISLLSIMGLTSIGVATFIACSSPKENEDVITLDADGGTIEDSDASSLKLNYEKNETWSKFYIANKYIGASKEGYDFICWTLDGETPIANDYVFTKPVTLKPLYVENRDCITIACRYLDDNFVDFANDYSISFSWPYDQPDVTATVEYAINDGNFQPYTSGAELNSQLSKTGDYFSFKSNGIIKSASATYLPAQFKISLNNVVENKTRFAISGPIDALTGKQPFTVARAFMQLFGTQESTSITDGIISASGLDLERELETECYSFMFGRATNLIYAPQLANLNLAQACYGHMFDNCTSLLKAPALPAEHLAMSCYVGMFSGCSSLTEAPTLPSMDIKTSCYNEMFYGCTSLIRAPELPANALSSNCYGSMFYGCTFLVSAPALPSITLADGCYDSMFRGCTALINVPDLPAVDSLFNQVYRNMFYGCTSLVTAPEIFLENISGTTQIFYRMFYNCTSLKFIKIHYKDRIISNTSFNQWLYGVNTKGSLLFNGPYDGPSTGFIPQSWTVYRF